MADPHDETVITCDDSGTNVDGGDAIGLPDRAFLIFSLAIGVAFFSLAQWVLPGEFFKSDDFTFLADVQRPDWTWREALVPLDTWSYWNVRPLGVDAYFRLCERFFGADPLGFFEINLLVHFAMAPIVFRLARQLGLGRAASAAAAILCISRPPSMRLLYYGAGFASLAVQLLIAATLSFHLEWIRSGRRLWLAGSLTCLFTALLTHEIAYVTPAVLAAASLMERRGAGVWSLIARTVRDVAPALAVVAPYLIVRFTLFAPLRADAGYGRVYAFPHVLRHLQAQLELFASAPWAFWSLALACLTIVSVTVAMTPARRIAVIQLGAHLGFCAAWALVVLAPILLLPHSHVRYSHYAEVPAALAVGVCLDFALRGLGARARSSLLAATAAWLVFIVPWASLAERRSHATMSPAAKFAAEVNGHVDPIPLGVTFVVRSGAAPLASKATSDRFSRQVHSGTTLVQALWRDKNPIVYFKDETEPWLALMICDTCVYLDMTPGMSFRVLDHDAAATAVFEPALRSERRGVQMAGARQLARQWGLAALPRLEAACRDHGSPKACRTRIEMAVAHSEAEEAAPLLRALRHAQTLAEPRDGML